MKKNKDILFASSNIGKIREFKNLLKDYNVVSLNDLEVEDAIEDGTSFLENALIKAKHGSLHSGKYTIADDSGLVVPGLNFEPGIYSARYAGSNASDKENRDKLIQKLNDLSVSSLNAYYVCCLVGVKHHDDPMPLVSFGTIHGKVSTTSLGSGGFGYDKIFYLDEYKCSMAEMDPKLKNTLSHRAEAIRDFMKKFEY